MDALILNEMTGSPKHLALKLGLSERSVYNYIAFMKNQLNAPIKYDYQRQSYVYLYEWDYKFNDR
jgi:hypothetical protein